MELIDGLKLKFKRNFDFSFMVIIFCYNNVLLLLMCFGIDVVVLWVDERNKDYLVVWVFDCIFVYYKKGDDSWRVFWLLMN